LEEELVKLRQVIADIASK